MEHRTSTKGPSFAIYRDLPYLALSHAFPLFAKLGRCSAVYRMHSLVVSERECDKLCSWLWLLTARFFFQQNLVNILKEFLSQLNF